MKQLHLFPESTQADKKDFPLQRICSLELASKCMGDEELDSNSQSTTESANVSLLDRLSINSSPSLTCGTYYDIPLPENATELETNVCKYLEKLGVHISHPEMKQSFWLVKSPLPLRKKSLLLERRKSLYVQNPGASWCAEGEKK